MFTNRVPSSLNQPPAQDMPGTDCLDLSEAGIGGGDPRIADLVNEARAQGFTIEERAFGRRREEQVNREPYRFDNVGD
jgi:hypothetical protein